MQVNIHPTIIFRTPRFSYQAEISDCWDELKAAIAISSEAFYQTIKDVRADELVSLPPKIYFTIWKYFNRTKYRSTPYGTFASFSILHNAVSAESGQIVINEQQHLTSLTDWPVKNSIQFNFRQLLDYNCLLFSNSSYYLTPDTLRYIACADGLFELAEIEQDAFVMQILEACLHPIRLNDLMIKLNLNDEGKEALFSLLCDMHEIQLIFSNYDANIIGDDYFNRIGFKQDGNVNPYIIAQRNASGGLSKQVLKSVPEAISFLQTILPSGGNEALNQFIKRFLNKFDDKEVSLLQALDPEMGVGYDELEQAGNGDDLVTRLIKPKTKENETNDIKTLLKEKLSPQYFKLNETIYLNKLPLKIQDKVKPIPNTISLLMRQSDDLLFVDQIGGVTANALSGRFTMADATVENYCKETAAIEQDANPDVLFFDVAYMVEANVDNINRRKLVYDAQLSILNFDTSLTPLTLNDIFISVQNSEVILRSKTLNRRVVPRMASAYNYTRSDLSVFRLLCDVQHHGVQTSLSLPLDKLLPDLDDYPRLQYQNLVLSPAKWRIEKKHLFNGNIPLSVIDCRTYLIQRGIKTHFKAGVSDQTLCFDLNRDDDLNAFLQYMQKQESVYLEEVVLPANITVTDNDGKPYLAQFILNLYHREKIYHKVVPHESNTGITEVFPPGKEWLYFEIFCHQQRADHVLTEIINPFIALHADQLKCWFFIRYNEGGNHIRFRMQLKNANISQQLTTALVDDLSSYLQSGMVSDIQVRTYKREINRYGASLMEDVEAHFRLDSEYVLTAVSSQQSQFDKIRYCLTLANAIGEQTDFGSRKYIDLIKLISGVFNDEHGLGPADFKKLNSEYQQFKNHVADALDEDQRRHFALFSSSFIHLLQKCTVERRFKLFSDLMHMHVNRLFKSDQRVHETIMYYFLLKELQRNQAMKG